MARILLSAYACEPDRGSEPQVGWSWATELARLGHQVTVITRAANRRTIEAHSDRLPQNLGFVYYDLPTWMQRVRRGPGGKQLYYVLWQWFAARAVRQRFPSLGFDVVQHATYVSARYPSFMGSLGIPFYFGPVSGGEAVPTMLRTGCSPWERCREAIRDISNALVRFDPLMRRTFRQASRILVTHDTLPLLPQSVRHKAEPTLTIGLPARAPESTNEREVFHCPARLHLLYVGRLLEWKGVDIALHALSMMRPAYPNVDFTIVGDGHAAARLQRLCRTLELEDVVRWAGWAPQIKLADYYRHAHLLLFPSLRDSGGMVVLEALFQDLPVVCTNLGGPGLIVNRTCGRAIATAGRTREQLARGIADALLEMVSIPGLLETVSRGARTRAREFSIERLVRSVYPTTFFVEGVGAATKTSTVHQRACASQSVLTMTIRSGAKDTPA